VYTETKKLFNCPSYCEKLNVQAIIIENNSFIVLFHDGNKIILVDVQLSRLTTQRSERVPTECGWLWNIC